ncbi:hypothetical protein ABPG74_013572 [Tetrahymena malaccensis]
MHQQFATNTGKKLPHIFTYHSKVGLFNLKEMVLLQQEISNFNIASKQSTQICFFVDATGSMKKHVDIVRQEIDKICDSIKKNQRVDTQIQVSMVAYRDRKDAKKTEKIDFTNNLDIFKSFIEQLKFEGGDDECEDVVIGFQEVTTLSWKKNSLNMIIWIADSPCHGEEFHDKSVKDDYPQDNGEDIKKLLKQICDLDIDIYFFKITDTTDKMINILEKQAFVNDKIIKQTKLQQNNFSKNVLKSYFGSLSESAYGEFYKYVKQLDKTKQIQKSLVIKGQMKEYQQKILLQQEYFDSLNNYNTRTIQEEDIQNIKEIQFKDAELISYKFKLNSNINIIELTQDEPIELGVSENIIGQGAFKETYLAQDQKNGNMYVLKKFKDSNQFDFDNLLMEYYIQLIAQNIRDDFIQKLKSNTDKSEHKDLKIFFDDQYIVKDQLNNQFYMMELAKNGFKKYINTDQQQLNNQNESQQQLFQSFLHFSFEYSSFDFMLSDIQGFGNTLNDISIHSQTLIDNFKVHKQTQLLEQFLKKKCVNMEGFQINTPIYSNLGNVGIVLFFNQHKCNKYCKSLNLKKIDGYNIQVKNDRQFISEFVPANTQKSKQIFQTKEVNIQCVMNNPTLQQIVKVVK